MTDLFILCDSCHEEYHNKTRAISIQSTTAFIKGQVFRTKKPKHTNNENVEFVKDRRIGFFEIMFSCQFCGGKIIKNRTKKHKSHHKSIVSPFYYKCKPCHKVFFPKHFKGKKQYDKYWDKKQKEKRIKLTKEQSKQAFDTYYETKRQNHAEKLRLWKIERAKKKELLILS